MAPTFVPLSASSATRWVVCLCADWCGVCREFRAAFEQVAHSLQKADADTRFAWVDVEDEADLIGDVDVETFPTVLVGNASGAYFVGPVVPQAHVLQRLLESMGPSAPRASGSADWADLLAALPDRPDFWIRDLS